MLPAVISLPRKRLCAPHFEEEWEVHGNTYAGIRKGRSLSPAAQDRPGASPLQTSYGSPTKKVRWRADPMQYSGNCSPAPRLQPWHRLPPAAGLSAIFQAGAPQSYRLATANGGRASSATRRSPCPRPATPPAGGRHPPTGSPGRRARHRRGEGGSCRPGAPPGKAGGRRARGGSGGAGT